MSEAICEDKKLKVTLGWIRKKIYLGYIFARQLRSKRNYVRPGWLISRRFYFLKNGGTTDAVALKVRLRNDAHYNNPSYAHKRKKYENH